MSKINKGLFQKVKRFTFRCNKKTVAIIALIIILSGGTGIGFKGNQSATKCRFVLNQLERLAKVIKIFSLPAKASSDNYETISIDNIVKDKGTYWLLYDNDTEGSVENPYFRYSIGEIIIKN